MNTTIPAQCQTKCPYCEELVLTPERIDIFYGVKTAAFIAPFYDSEGKQHHHDTNRYTENLRCNNGHCFTRVVPHECWCGWRQDEEEQKSTSVTWTANVLLNTTVKVDAYAPQVDELWEIVKEVAEGGDPYYCSFCKRHNNSISNLRHDDNCVVAKAYRLVWRKQEV